MNPVTDLLGQRVSVIESEGMGVNYKVIGEHPGIIRAIYTNENHNVRFMVEEAGRLIVRLPNEFKLRGSGL